VTKLTPKSRNGERKEKLR